MELSANDRALLAIYAAATATAPVDLYTATEAVLPKPANRDGRTREYRAWAEQMDVLVRAWLGLYKAGLIREHDDYDGHGSDSVITEAGRAALAAAEGRTDA